MIMVVSCWVWFLVSFLLQYSIKQTRFPCHSLTHNKPSTVCMSIPHPFPLYFPATTVVVVVGGHLGRLVRLDLIRYLLLRQATIYGDYSVKSCRTIAWSSVNEKYAGLNSIINSLVVVHKNRRHVWYTVDDGLSGNQLEIVVQEDYLQNRWLEFKTT